MAPSQLFVRHENPIEEAFSKAKILIRMARTLEAVSEEDARGYFEACGYGTFWGHSL